MSCYYPFTDDKKEKMKEGKEPVNGIVFLLLYMTYQTGTHSEWSEMARGCIIVMGDTQNIGSITITFRTKYRWYRLLKRLLVAESS